MEIRIRCTQQDLLENSQTILADGKAYLIDDTLTYVEKDHPDVQHAITFDKDEVILKRKAEIQSETHIPHEGVGKSTVLSPYGMMVLETKIEEVFKNDELWMVQYQILENGSIVSHQKLVWELKGVADE